MLAACAARRWLARNAAGVKVIRSYGATEATVYGEASACASLVSCLPALEDVTLSPNAPLVRDDLGCLLEALAWCPRLTALDLCMGECRPDAEDEEDLYWPFPDAAVFAKLRGLTKLALFANEDDPFDLADVVAALMPLTGLIELDLGSLQQHDIMPAALRQLKQLRSLTLRCFVDLVLEAGCLDLPNLESLKFEGCGFEEDSQVLPGVTALQRLTCFELSGAEGGPRFFDPQLAQLPLLQRLVLSQDTPVHGDFASGDMASCDPPGLLRLPADMGALKTSLLSVDLTGLVLTRFPLALTQLVALECLRASENDFVALPASITALSKLTELRLGRVMSWSDPLQLSEKRPLDVRALGDLSGFPVLRELTLVLSEVMLSHSLLGAVRHASLASLCFCNAHPAPECEQVVLQLGRELRRLGRGRVVSLANEGGTCQRALEDAQGRAPCQKFKAALEAGGL